ncbi:MAG: DoxX family membrane protein [Patescibacteria group bacterium]
MSQFQKFTVFLSREVMGWFFFYAGITKVLNPEWSAAGYLKGAKMFAGFYQWLLSPEILPFINFTNKWGLTLLGISLMLGIGVRLSSLLGAILMLLYYFPILDGFYPNTHAFIVDEHVIYTTVLLMFAANQAGRAWGFESWFARKTGIGSWFG